MIAHSSVSVSTVNVPGLRQKRYSWTKIVALMAGSVA